MLLGYEQISLWAHRSEPNWAGHWNDPKTLAWLAWFRSPPKKAETKSSVGPSNLSTSHARTGRHVHANIHTLCYQKPKHISQRMSTSKNTAKPLLIGIHPCCCYQLIQFTCPLEFLTKFVSPFLWWQSMQRKKSTESTPVYTTIPRRWTKLASTWDVRT